MFELVTMSDNVKIVPGSYGETIELALKKELNRKLANKVFYKHGLCIILFDILHIGDSLILPGDGSWNGSFILSTILHVFRVSLIRAN